jgi:2-dehydropantoate 2-reductase
MVCCQNGINDDRIAAVVGEGRTMGVIMTISAAVYEPGIALRTDLNEHCFKVGELDGSETARAAELAAMLSSAIGPSSLTTNIWGQRWSKLMINCMNNGLAGLTGWMTAQTRTHPSTQPIGIQLAAEVVRVARAKGVCEAFLPPHGFCLGVRQIGLQLHFFSLEPKEFALHC